MKGNCLGINYTTGMSIEMNLRSREKINITNINNKKPKPATFLPSHEKICNLNTYFIYFSGHAQNK